MLLKYRGYILLTLVYALGLGTVVFFLRQPDSATIEIIPPPTPLPPATATSVPTPAPLRVYVTGAVHNVDVYTLPPNSIIKDAVVMAGGTLSQADLLRVNLALPLYDGQQIYIPTQDESVEPITIAPPPTIVATTNSPARDAGGEMININTATLEQLDTLPGIGPSRAQAIIDNRPYDTVEDITKVYGIGAVTLEKIRDKITVE